MPGTLRESMALLTEAYDKWDLIGMNFKNDMYNRDVANEDRLPHYPYRDDGNLLWEAIEEWCNHYVNEVYSGDDEVADDIELQVPLTLSSVVIVLVRKLLTYTVLSGSLDQTSNCFWHASHMAAMVFRCVCFLGTLEQPAMHAAGMAAGRG